MTVDLARLPEALRDHGLRVVEMRDWLDVGYDYVVLRGQLTHHTGGSGPVTDSTRDFMRRGRVGANEPHPLEGPLCNMLEGVAPDGVYEVSMVAGRRARHAGPGSRQVWEELLRDEHDDRSAFERGLADDDSVHGNRHLLGREVQHPGSGPVSDVLIDGVGRSSAAVAEFFGWHPNRHKGHLHWTARKTDPVFARTHNLPDLTHRYLEDDDMTLDELNAALAAALEPVKRVQAAQGKELDTIKVNTKKIIDGRDYKGVVTNPGLRDLAAAIEDLAAPTSNPGSGRFVATFEPLPEQGP